MKKPHRILCSPPWPAARITPYSNGQKVMELLVLLDSFTPGSGLVEPHPPR